MPRVKKKPSPKVENKKRSASEVLQILAARVRRIEQDAGQVASVMETMIAKSKAAAPGS